MQEVIFFLSKQALRNYLYKLCLALRNSVVSHKFSLLTPALSLIACCELVFEWINFVIACIYTSHLTLYLYHTFLYILFHRFINFY